MTPGRIIALIFGVVLAPAAIGLVVGGIALLVAFGTLRNADGFIESPSYALSSNDYALASADVAIAPHPGDWWPTRVVAELALVATPQGNTPVFVGIGPTDDVARYLSGVAYDEVRDLDRPGDDVRYRHFAGAAPAGAPGAQSFWAATAEGIGPQRLTFDVERGSWTVVIMNADGSQGVRVATVGAVRIPVLPGIGFGMLIAGLFIAALAAMLLVFAFRHRASATGGAPLMGATRSFGVTGIPTAYPLAIEGRIDAPLSRGLWLIKWFLAIPHYIILSFLGMAFALLTVVAFFAILFTGRYPRGIFDFNVGVMRWGWRVLFYATGVLGTDRYPPFTLADVDYPARLNVAYPGELSRGLVLVKWWLLAIPHYIIVGVLTSGLIWWTTDLGYGESILQIGGGIIGVLGIVVGLALLFTGRYPQGLFDLLMGLNRWCFRVAAYATLMTDEYPPFRLDLGGTEPPETGAALPAGAALDEGR